MTPFTEAQLMRLEAIRREASELFDRIQDLEDEAYEITKEKDPLGHTTDLLYQSNCSVEELVERLKGEEENHD